MKLWTYSIIENNGDSVTDLVQSAIPNAAWKSPVRARDEANAETLSLFDTGLNDARHTTSGDCDRYYIEDYDVAVIVYSIELKE